MKKYSFLLLLLLWASFKAGAQEKNVTGSDIGMVAPEITGKDPDGKVLKLSDLRGYVVLVDFWASWCGPCRHENPTVVKAYQTYSKLKMKDAKGFRIFSVSLDLNSDAWKTAIKKDGLVWKYHVSELKSWSAQAVKDYKVGSIPANFLLGPDGVIRAKNLRGESLLLELEKWVKY